MNIDANINVLTKELEKVDRVSVASDVGEKSKLLRSYFSIYLLSHKFKSRLIAKNINIDVSVNVLIKEKQKVDRANIVSDIGEQSKLLRFYFSTHLRSHKFESRLTVKNINIGVNVLTKERPTTKSGSSQCRVSHRVLKQTSPVLFFHPSLRPTVHPPISLANYPWSLQFVEQIPTSALSHVNPAAISGRSSCLRPLGRMYMARHRAPVKHAIPLFRSVVIQSSLTTSSLSPFSPAEQRVPGNVPRR